MAHYERGRDARAVTGAPPVTTAHAVARKEASASLSVNGGRQALHSAENAQGERTRASTRPLPDRAWPNTATSQLLPLPSDDDYDDEDDDVDQRSASFGDEARFTSAGGHKDRRREAHTFAEQKRRDSIKRGYDELQRLVPTCHMLDSAAHEHNQYQQQEAGTEITEQSAAGSAAALTGSATKLSKAVVLQRSIDYIQHLVKQQRKQSQELESLRKEVMALRIMKSNYEEMVKGHRCYAPRYGNSSSLPDNVKLSVFTDVIDRMFASFDSTVCTSSFAELSACMFYWLEEYCKPRLLRDVMMAALQNTTDEHQQTGLNQPLLQQQNARK